MTAGLLLPVTKQAEEEKKQSNDNTNKAKDAQNPETDEEYMKRIEEEAKQMPGTDGKETDEQFQERNQEEEESKQTFLKRDYKNVPEQGMYWEALPSGASILMRENGIPAELADRLVNPEVYEAGQYWKTETDGTKVLFNKDGSKAEFQPATTAKEII